MLLGYQCYWYYPCSSSGSTNIHTGINTKPCYHEPKDLGSALALKSHSIWGPHFLLKFLITSLNNVGPVFFFRGFGVPSLGHQVSSSGPYLFFCIGFRLFLAEDFGTSSDELKKFSAGCKAAISIAPFVIKPLVTFRHPCKLQ